MKKQLDLFDYTKEELGAEESKYTRKVSTPIYTPRGEGNLYACYDNQKYFRLIRLIDKSNVSEEEKTFLKMAATRFIEFNYESIADYYASANGEMQELMEKLALIIIDFDKAIENGLIRLNDNMRRLYELELD